MRTKHVLVRQLRHDLIECAVELLRPLGKERAPSRRLGVVLQPGSQLGNRCAAPEADRIEHRVARLDPGRCFLARRQAAPVVAIRENDDALAAPLAADQIDGAHCRVIESGPSPGAQQVDGALTRLLILLTLRREEQRVVEPDERGRVAVAELREKLLHGRLYLVERSLHASAHVNREDEIERRVLGREARDALLHTVFRNLEILRLQPADELAALRHDHRHEDGLGADVLRKSEILRIEVVRQPAAARQRRDDPHVVPAHDLAGIPVAPERRALDRTGQAAVDRKGDRLHRCRRLLWLDRHLETRRAGDDGIARRRDNPERGRLSRLDHSGRYDDRDLQPRRNRPRKPGR